MIGKSIKVSVPATVSNLGCGFDIMGFALEQSCDEITIKVSKGNEIRISKITGDNGKLPLNIDENTCTVAIKSIVKACKIDFGLDIKIKKIVGFGSGLGSSAASAVAGVFAIDKLFNLNLSKIELLNHAMEGEKIASKAIHADNVAPCLYGGVILIRSYEPIDIIEILSPSDLYCTIIHPQIEIKTSEARKLIPKNISLKNGIKQWGNVGALVAGFMKNDISLIGRSVKDVVAEPKRSKLIPGYDLIKEAALSNGAVACNISGSGPAIFAFSDNKLTAENVAKAMKKVVSKMGIKSKTFVSQINTIGPKVIK